MAWPRNGAIGGVFSRVEQGLVNRFRCRGIPRDLAVLNVGKEGDLALVNDGVRRSADRTAPCEVSAARRLHKAVGMEAEK